LRARCPACRTFTAVALGPDYECHACGREFPAGLVRVPRAWGNGGEAMAEAAGLDLPYPEAAVIAEDSLGEQTLALVTDLPERPVVLGGCCCSHVGAVEALGQRHGRVAVIWFDAHGDLNTPESSPSGNQWGMPLRMLIDSGSVLAEDVALIGARNLDPPEEEFIAASRLHLGEDGAEPALSGARGAYVAFDCDALDPADISCWMPEPDGLALDEAARMLEALRGRADLLGLGFTGLTPDPANLGALGRLCAAAGL
jgi:arginase family enzyme